MEESPWNAYEWGITAFKLFLPIFLKILEFLAGFFLLIVVSWKLFKTAQRLINFAIYHPKKDEVDSPKKEAIKRVKELMVDPEQTPESAMLIASTETNSDMEELLKEFKAMSPYEIKIMLKPKKNLWNIIQLAYFRYRRSIMGKK